MKKYTLGVWMTTIAASVIAGMHYDISTGIATAFVVLGVAYMITGTLESVLRVVLNK